MVVTLGGRNVLASFRLAIIRHVLMAQWKGNRGDMLELLGGMIILQIKVGKWWMWDNRPP
jgi:hypothetical protein